MSEHGPFCFRNNTNDPLNGLHVIFTGGGRLRGGRITVGPPGRITTVDNQLNVLLNDVLAPGMVLCLTVSSAHPLHQHAALPLLERRAAEDQLRWQVRWRLSARRRRQRGAV